MSSPLSPRPLNTMQRMALRAVAENAYVVERHTEGGWRDLPWYRIHVMGKTINAQIASLGGRELVKWRPEKLTVELTLKGKEELEKLAI